MIIFCIFSALLRNLFSFFLVCDIIAWKERKKLKIVVYADVHGNKYALEALQSTEDYKAADLRVFVGDAVAMCPYPNECLEMIWNNGDTFLMGNHDSYCAYGLPEKEWPYFKSMKKTHQAYMIKKTKPENRERLKTMPKSFECEFFGKKFYFTHFVWNTERLVMGNPDGLDKPSEKTIKLFDNIKADYIFFGHNHMPADLSCDGRRLICVGSLGMKYPGYYVVVNIDEQGVTIDRKTVQYDLETLKNEILTENYPSAKGFVKWFDE